MKGFFVLRPEHENAFGDAGLHRFAKKAIRMLRQDHPEVANATDDKSLLALTKNWIDYARRFGLITERQMYWIIEAALYLRNRNVEIAREDQVSRFLGSARPANQRAEILRDQILRDSTDEIV